MKRLSVLLLIWSCFCTAAAQTFSAAELLRFPDGRPVTDAKAWHDERRPQLLDTLRRRSYGYIPDSLHLGVTYETLSENRTAMQGRATLRQVRITFAAGGRTKTAELMLLIPNQVKRPPVFLGYNFHGNYTVTAEPDVAPTGRWISQRLADGSVVHRAREELRGSDAAAWQAEAMIRRGYALATLYYGDIYEDYDGGYDDSVAPLIYSGTPARKPCGRLGLWAWGLIRAMDYLQGEKLVDPERVFVTGVSRLGKAALWAGAQDERFAMVVPHCAGGVVKLADGKELLLALAAPRPLYSTTSEKDIYALPRLEFAYLRSADSIYRFLGRPGLCARRLPGLCEPVREGYIGFHINPGRHGVKPYDWEQAMNFADGIFGRPASPLPDLLGNCRTPQQWHLRRDSLLRLFEEHEYGRIPAHPGIRIAARTEHTDRRALNGTATRKEVTLTFRKDGRSCGLHLLLYIPNGLQHPAAVFLGLNFGGNHTVCGDPGITLPDTRPGHPKDEVPGRGADSTGWNIRETLQRGYAVATFCNSDLCEDRPQGPALGAGAMLYPEGRDSGSCGFIGITAWGLSRVMDYLEREPLVDARRVALIGCSRNGKIALWAGAQDERFAVVISSSSGSGGASLFRGNRAESIGDIAGRFPHWMAPSFARYARCTGEFPVDQHQLLALIAPRPLYVADSDRDPYAVPKDEFAALKAALPAYGLFYPDLPALNSAPAVGVPVQGIVGFHTKQGGHSITPFDWRCYYDFADLHFGRPEFRKNTLKKSK